MTARAPKPPATPDPGTFLGRGGFPGGSLDPRLEGAVESPTPSDSLACASQCGVQNFKRREKCFKCGVPKSGMALLPPSSPGRCWEGGEG